MNDQEILASLQSQICPACDGKKRQKQSHCSKCYYKLPREMQKALYKRFFEGYQEAFRESINFLKRLPKGKTN